MNNLNYYIQEKLRLSKDTKSDIDLNSADYIFTDACELSELGLTIFNTDVQNFIDKIFDTYKKIYVWYVEDGTDKYDEIDDLIKQHREYHGINNPNELNDDKYVDEYAIVLSNFKNSYKDVFVLPRKRNHQQFYWLTIE